MSNKSGKKKQLNPTDLNTLAKVKWGYMQTDLKSALGSWSELDTSASKSPEEEQLDKVKTLIENLKQKLNDF